MLSVGGTVTAAPAARKFAREAGVEITGYARVAVARSGAGWTVSGNAVSNAAAVTFGACTAGSNTVTYFSVGTDSSGAGTIRSCAHSGTACRASTSRPH